MDSCKIRKFAKEFKMKHPKHTIDYLYGAGSLYIFPSIAIKFFHPHVTCVTRSVFYFIYLFTHTQLFPVFFPTTLSLFFFGI